MVNGYQVCVGPCDLLGSETTLEGVVSDDVIGGGGRQRRWRRFELVCVVTHFSSWRMRWASTEVEEKGQVGHFMSRN